MTRLTARQRECLYEIEADFRRHDPEFVATFDRLWELSVEPIGLSAPPRLRGTRQWLATVTSRGRLVVAAGLVLLMTMLTLVVTLRSGGGRMPPRNPRVVQLAWWGVGRTRVPLGHTTGAERPEAVSGIP